jgi:hypothetical protein
VYFLKVPPKPDKADADARAAVQQASLELQALFKKQLRHDDALPKSPDLGKADINSKLADVQRPMLLVLDNVWDKAIADNMTFSKMQGAVLVTARTLSGHKWPERKMAADPQLLAELQSAAKQVFYKELQGLPTELGGPAEQQVRPGRMLH